MLLPIFLKIVNQNLDCGFVTGFKHHHHINKVELFKEKLVLISGTEMTQLEDITSAVFLVFKMAVIIEEILKPG